MIKFIEEHSKEKTHLGYLCCDLGNDKGYNECKTDKQRIDYIYSLYDEYGDFANKGVMELLKALGDDYSLKKLKLINKRIKEGYNPYLGM